MGLQLYKQPQSCSLAAHSLCDYYLGLAYTVPAAFSSNWYMGLVVAPFFDHHFGDL